jgi:hypothetical protein
MQQKFNTRNYSIRDFEQWHLNKELTLAPKFQRRSVWNKKARSFLIDTIIRGKPIPKIFMRQDINPKTRRTTREIVDGQQRLRTVLDFLEDGFPILKTHNANYGNLHFSQLDEDTQRSILKYEFAVDLLQDMPDQEIYDIFARLNTYSIILNAQEQRNGRFFGDFKTSVYTLSNEFTTFWQINNIFSEQKLLRMAEAEFVSELLIAISVGIQVNSKKYIDNFYNKYDNHFPDKDLYEERFRSIMDIVGDIIQPTAKKSKLREPRLIYALFCAIYHLQYGLPDESWKQISITPKDYVKIRIALESIEQIFEKLQLAKEIAENDNQEDEKNIDDETLENETLEMDPLTVEERKFYDTYDKHWTHRRNRRFRTQYICQLIIDELQ